MKRFLLFWCLALLVGCGKNETSEIELPVTEMSKAVECAIRQIELLERSANDSAEVDIKLLNVTSLTVGDFKRELEEMPGEMVRVWMPGRYTWMVVGSSISNQVEVAKAMITFTFDTECPSVAQIFASYAGTREEILPAFEAGDMKVKPRPEFFLTKDALTVPYLSFEGIDEDITKMVQDEILAVQNVRRKVVEGDMLADAADDLEGEKKAIDCWAKAAEVNPLDSFLLERVENLERNANGFLEVGKFLQAMKCYETIVSIYPNNASALHNFGICLKKLGRSELADRALKRAEELMR